MDSSNGLTKEQLLAEEEALKESVYTSFQKEMEKSNRAVLQAKTSLDSGGYESQFVSVFASDLSKQRRHQLQITREIKSLYNKPYFSHIRLFVPDDKDVIHCLLSDCPDLDEIKTIEHGEAGEALIIPFKQDAQRALFTALFGAYQAKNGARFSITNRDGSETAYVPEIIRDVSISSRVLHDVRQFFPELTFDEEVIDFDDVLAMRLDENRESAVLRNIIATLQREQYSIVQTPQEVSFVVQGCAGSGKSQCLIHRLFFLRSALSNNGWDKVLLITPSQLFRSYSSELMTRFRLSSVSNISIAELYRELLFRIDSRFKNRQYRFELSEEYLPDVYLRKVYSRDTIQKIRSEIIRSIANYVNEACGFLNIPVPEAPITISVIQSLTEKLEREIAAVSLREQERSKDERYSAMRAEADKLEKEIIVQKKMQARLLQRRDELDSRSRLLDKLRDDLDLAEAELSDWTDGLKAQNEDLKKEVDSAVSQLNSQGLNYSSIGLVNDYLVKVTRFLGATCEWGEKNRADAEHTEFLRGYIELCQQELLAFSKGKSVNATERTIQKDISENEKRIQLIDNHIADLELRIEQIIRQLQDYTKDESVRSQTRARIEAMEASRYFLSRVESSVFEREIWNALAPLKEQCGIKTLDIEELGNGRRRETRILYKSDLLFYLRIYMYLSEANKLPPYEYICIDEGQDLHEADYETLRELFPNAVFNVFGDIDQALHVDCGISQWEKETGIPKVFELNKNYRNTPATVEFIKERFGARMEACGRVKEDQRPTVIRSAGELKQLLEASSELTIIVKDYQAFQTLCDQAGDAASQLHYLDTSSTEEKDGTTSCFSVYAAKGLEFSKALVWPDGMTANQQVVACTRALRHLYYYER